MTEAHLRQFLDGLLVAWAVDATVETWRAGDELHAVVRDGGGALCEVRRGVAPFGAVWRVEAPGARPRTHPSVQGAIRSLGTILAPARPVGRVTFAGGLAGDA